MTILLAPLRLRPAALLLLAATTARTTPIASAFATGAAVNNFAAATSPSRAFTSTTPLKMSSADSAAEGKKPICIVVEAEIKPDRMDEFLDLIEKDAVGSRAEPGCLRFDVLRSQDNPNKFFFYEAYVDMDAVTFHKAQPHFALWTKFKETEGIVSSVSHKADGLFVTA